MSEDDDGVLIVCSRWDAAGVRIPGTTRGTCERCGADIKIAPSSARLKYENASSCLICEQCAYPLDAFYPVMPIDDSQFEEIASVLGQDEAERVRASVNSRIALWNRNRVAGG
ncbi:MAG: hypothetical protein SVP26_03085 [Chloroflexota bacterium]|nr:hypothetical protein [Chloroflexota bacterium]